MKPLTTPQRNALLTARKAAVDAQTLIDQLAGGSDAVCECEDNPGCRVCAVFAVLGQLPHDLERARELIDQHLTRG